jgi:hypothetical protein
MDQVRTSEVQGRGRDVERPPAPKHCQVLRLVGVNEEHQVVFRVKNHFERGSFLSLPLFH